MAVCFFAAAEDSRARFQDSFAFEFHEDTMW